MRTVFLVGPTAVGKTSVAVAVAPRLDAEIVSADSMQVYRGMDIGTAKPSAAERRAVPHHLLDVVEPEEVFDAKRFVDLASAAIAGIHARGRTALVVGGTGMYVRALRQGLFTGPARNPELRVRLEAMTAAELYAELAPLDPAAAATIDRHNPRRLVRALEVFHATGKSIRELQREWGTNRSAVRRESPPPEGWPEPQALSLSNGSDEGRGGSGAHPHRGGTDDTDPPRPPVQTTARASTPPGEGMNGICLARERSDLHARIAARIDEQIQAGWVAEVVALLARGVPATATAMQAAGYRELAAYLRGECSLAAAVALIKMRTRQLARRQLTWFRREPGLIWLDVPAAEPPAVTAERISAGLSRDAG